MDQIKILLVSKQKGGFARSFQTLYIVKKVICNGIFVNFWESTPHVRSASLQVVAI